MSDLFDFEDAKNLIDKVWNAGTVGFRRHIGETEDEAVELSAALVALVRKIMLSTERDSLLNRIFTTPRNTGILLLGFCSLVQWRYETYIIKLFKIIQHVKCGNLTIAISHPRAAHNLHSRRRRQVQRPALVENAESDDFNGSPQSQLALPSAGIALPNPVDIMMDFSTFLQDLEGTQELLSLQDQLDQKLQVSDSQVFRINEAEDDEEVAPDAVPLIMEDEEDESFFFAPSSASQHSSSLTVGGPLILSPPKGPNGPIASPLEGSNGPVPSLSLGKNPNMTRSPASSVIINASGSSDVTELVTMRHTEAPSARVRKRDSIEASVLQVTGTETSKQAKVLRTRDHLHSKRVRSLFPVEDSGCLTRERSEEGATTVSGRPGASFEWRAVREIPLLWTFHISQLSVSLKDRFTCMISNELLNKYLAAKGNSGSSDSLYSTDYFRNPEEPQMEEPLSAAVLSSDRRSAHFGLSWSNASSVPIADVLTPSLSLSEENSSWPKVVDGFAETHTPLEDMNIDTSVDKTVASSRTMSNAENRYNPYTWQLLCIIKNNLKKRAQHQHQPISQTFIFFHDLVQTDKCKRRNAAQALYQLLLLLTLNDLACHQSQPFGAIKIMLSSRSMVMTTSTELTSTGTCCSELLEELRGARPSEFPPLRPLTEIAETEGLRRDVAPEFPPLRPLTETAEICKKTSPAKRGRRERLLNSPRSGSSSSGDKGTGNEHEENENAVPLNRARKRRRLVE
eukprot:Gregarina_sp_Poly_1__4121@NODE_225_length_11206_cov_83_083760_g199_i0_p1_GENE_NODE_225_length_11206_cov_83_083760_g199_i0NODE_225_length_11206_cov_83_083760_g199_i0_p1_ORF_typecomplete_len739_score114_63Rad21_Rec8/PF04824_16/3_9e06SMC_ScpA/PF02616_14/0_16_NODE_225_length_11206_cov_83_083760_g199_i038876103